MRREEIEGVVFFFLVFSRVFVRYGVAMEGRIVEEELGSLRKFWLLVRF